ncbi:MAG: LapA family protein [Rugosibacter sp.]|nr:MAG: LapA family protein [Rugosibacter sp.]TBR08077.1 MAG: LapA family protein [Rugosibacter sp.]
MQLLTITAMIFAACAVIFALQNNIPVAVTFLLWHFDGSLAIVLLIALALGGFIVALVSTPGTLRRQWAIKRLNKRVSELESTCSSQKANLADLESRLPADSPASQKPPYVGLKDIILGKSGNIDDRK